MSAVGKWMSQASRTRGHVAHMLLHVRPQGVIFVTNLTKTWYCWTVSGSPSALIRTNGRWGDGPVPGAVSPRGARDHLGFSVAEIYYPNVKIADFMHFAYSAGHRSPTVTSAQAVFHMVMATSMCHQQVSIRWRHLPRGTCQEPSITSNGHNFGKCSPIWTKLGNVM